MEVPAVDQGDLDRPAAQLQRRLEPAEAAPDDYDVVSARLGHACFTP
jgi:hypothetical protein